MIKKLFVVIAVLALLAGTAYAASTDEGWQRELFAQGKGRSVVSDGSVLLQIYYTGTASHTSVGVSPNTTDATSASDSDTDIIRLYEDSTTSGNISVEGAINGNLQGIANQINVSGTWVAIIGPDGYGGYDATNHLLPQNISSPGGTKSGAVKVYLSSEDASEILVGVEATENKITRLKKLTSRVPVLGPSNSGGTAGNTVPYCYSAVTRVYNGDTQVWRSDISQAAYNTTTARDASPGTVDFAMSANKGLSADMGKSLVVRASANTITWKTPESKAFNASILYDQF